MPIDDTKKAKIKSNIEQLEYVAGLGISGKGKRKLNRGLYLFISSGGNGRMALLNLKGLLENKLDKEELKKIALLAVDCASTELDDAVAKEQLSRDETFAVPSDGQKQINPDNLSIQPNLKAWVHDELYSQSRATGASLSGFDTNGAGAWRQPGRIRFYLCAENYVNKIRAMVNRLMAGNQGVVDNTHPIRIFFLASVSGGTGSGTLLDMALLTRHALKDYKGLTPNHIRLNAYILSPNACEGTATVGNQDVNVNAYAAMKEIAYLMKLGARNETYTFRYNGFTVSMNEKNIFDFCTLVDGSGALAVFHNPAKTARDVIANSIFNLLTIQDSDAFSMDSFLSNESVSLTDMLTGAGRLLQDFPRAADYNYGVIGFNSIKLPLELLKLLQAYKMFEILMKRFDGAGEPNEKTAQIFLDECGYGLKKAYRITIASIEKTLPGEAKKVLKNKGPAYLVNLMKMAADEAGEREKYHRQRNSEKHERAAGVFKKVKEICTDLNSRYYEALREVIFAIRDLLEKDYRILSDAHEYQETFARTLTWCPVDFPRALTDADHATILQFLEGMFPAKYLGDQADAFMSEIEEHLAELTDLGDKVGGRAARFDAQKVISDFVQDKFGRKIDEAAEKLIVKAFSTNPDAEVIEIDPVTGEQVLTADAEHAVSEIVQHLRNNAAPLANITTDTGGSGIDSFPYNIVLTVPACCSHLIDKIKDRARNAGLINNENDVNASTSMDEITLQRAYCCVPAFRFNWVGASDAAYQIQKNLPGRHLEQLQRGAGEDKYSDSQLLHNWVNLPPLYNEACWTPAQRTAHEDEVEILNTAKKDFENAIEYGICRPVHVGGGITEYHVFKIARSANDELRKKDFEDYIDALTLTGAEPNYEACIQELKNSSLLKEFHLKRGADVLQLPPGTEPPDGFYEDYAYKILRMRIRDWVDLRNTLPLVIRLKEKVDALHEQWAVNQRRNARLNTFKMLLCSGNNGENDFIAYDAERMEWQIHCDDAKPWELLCNLPHKFYAEEFCEYYAFDALCNLGEENYNALVGRLNARMNDGAIFREINSRVRAFSASCRSLYTNRNNGAVIKIEGSITAGDRTIRYPMADAHFCDGTTVGDSEEDIETKKEIMKVYALLAGIQVN